MKKIQLNLKKRDRDNLKHMSSTYEDTHMKETIKLENDVNPDVFLMNSQLKNKNNEHLFNMDFSEFLPTVRKKDNSLESIQEQEPSHLMKDIELNNDIESFSFLDKLDNIDKIDKIDKIDRSYSKHSIKDVDRSYSKHSIQDVDRSYSKHSIQSLNIIKEEPTNIISKIPKLEPIISKKIYSNKPETKEIPIQNSLDNTKIDDFKHQLMKLNSYKRDTLKRYRTHTNTLVSKNSVPKIPKLNTKLNTNPKLYINTSHEIPNDPIFKEPLLNNYVKPKILSPKFIPPPKIFHEKRLSPKHIDFPYDKELKELEKDELETQYTCILPKGNQKKMFQKRCNESTYLPVSKPISKPISKPVSNPIIKEKTQTNKKLAYKHALYKVLKNKNKIKSDKYEHIPKKVLKDLYRFSNKIDINYSI